MAGGKLAQRLVALNATYLAPWLDDLRPVKARLADPLSVIFRDARRHETERLQASSILADYLRDDPARAAELLPDADFRAFANLFPIVGSTSTVVEGLTRVAATLPPKDLDSVARVAFGQRRANAAVTLLRLGRPEEALRVFDWTDDPEALTQIVFRCRDRGVDVLDLLDCLERVSSASADRFSRDARYALLLALGEFPREEVPESRRLTFLKQLADWYRTDPSSGVHGAAGWLLRQWGQTEVVRAVDQTPVPYAPDREWFTLAVTVLSSKPDSASDDVTPPQTPAPFHYTFIVFPAAEYTIGSVKGEPDQEKDETQHRVRLTRPFAACWIARSLRGTKRVRPVVRRSHAAIGSQAG